MKVVARHERDDRDIELDTAQELELEQELGLSVSTLWVAGIVAFEKNDGWHYRLVG